MKKIYCLIICLLALSLTVNNALAEELTLDEELSAERIYEFPEIEPEFKLSGGYRMVDLNGSRRADEFEYLEDTFTFGGNVVLFRYPHRFSLELEFKNKNDYFGDLSYAYKDIILFRGISRRLFHNLENIDLTDPTIPPSLTDPRDEGKNYDVDVGINTGMLQFKTPDFPLHVYLNGRLVDKNGDQQQRFLGGAGYFITAGFANGRTRVSQDRDIDWETKEYTVGMNSHLRWIEADISHTEKRFDNDGDEVFYDNYLAAGDAAPFIRDAGFYPHNAVPDLKGSTNTLKLHTAYTGKLVASATFSDTDRENDFSDVEADLFVGSGSVTWMPITKLAFFFKYRHKDLDFDNREPVPSIVTWSTAPVRESISSVTDTYSLTGRYRPFSRLTLRANYTHKNHRRSKEEAWELPSSTEKDTFSVSADARIMKGLKVKLKYTNKHVDDPAYNVEPNHSNEGKLTVSWLPIPEINTYVSYSLARETRNHLHFVDGSGAFDSPEDREVDRDNFFGSITFLLLQNLALTTSYSYLHNKVDEDVAYHLALAPFPRQFDTGVPYKYKANVYAATIHYTPKYKLNFDAGITHTRNKGKFHPSDPNLLDPVSIGEISEVEIRETVYSVSSDYEFYKGFSFGVDYHYNDFNDVADSAYDDVDDGDVHVIWLSLSKKWG